MKHLTWRPLILAVAVAVTTAGCTPTATTAPPTPTVTTTTAPPRNYTAGEVGLGDPYVGTAGNGGYDVRSYDLDLRYDPKTDRISGTATITATATQDLSRFNLDLRALEVSAASVDGAAAQTSAKGDELTVTPAAGLPEGTDFVTTLQYAGVPKTYKDPGLGSSGFLTTADGAFAMGEPQVAAAWFPVNDHPRDKATYAISIEVPQGLSAISNGVLTSMTTNAGWTTWNWSESKPMASYLATVVIGSYRVSQTTHKGKPVVTAVHTSLSRSIDKQLARTPQVVDFLATQFGPYPFDAMGGIVIPDKGIHFALENQTRPIYGPSFFGGGDAGWVLAHELAHQWFGDSVSVSDWRDLWLNEGFATYAEWLWSEHTDGATAKEIFNQLYADKDQPFWSEPPGAPATDDLFSMQTGSVYTRGGLTLGALRKEVGDKAFFTILKRWAAEQAGKSATTTQFMALAEEVSGKQLDTLFQKWLYGTKRP